MTAISQEPTQQGPYHMDPQTIRRMEQMICTLARSVCRAVNAMDRAEFPPRPRPPKAPVTEMVSVQAPPSAITPSPLPQPEPEFKPTAVPAVPPSVPVPPISDLRISVQTRCTLL